MHVLTHFLVISLQQHVLDSHTCIFLRVLPHMLQTLKWTYLLKYGV